MAQIVRAGTRLSHTNQLVPSKVSQNFTPQPPPLITCNDSVGGDDGRLFQLAGIWKRTCPMFSA